jgi:hypothetical protein
LLDAATRIRKRRRRFLDGVHGISDLIGELRASTTRIQMFRRPSLAVARKGAGQVLAQLRFGEA